MPMFGASWTQAIKLNLQRGGESSNWVIMAAKKFVIQRSGAPATPAAPVTDPRSALAAVLTMTFAHTAEVFEAFATAVSEHYDIDREEMFGVIKAHPAWESIQLHPALKDLGYLPAPAPAPAPTAAPCAKKKKFIIKSTPPGSVAEP